MSAHDYHVHSNYSDGSFLWRMADAAEALGLDGLGFADHCTVADDPERVRERDGNGFALDLTYRRRRDAIDRLRADTDLTLYDAVEMDFDPAWTGDIEEFLAGAGFDYAIGSVHHLDGVNVHFAGHFADKPEAERRALVDEYFEKLVALVDSELFDVAAHLDLVERNPHLRSMATREHYERVADALAISRTVPEVNAGRATEGLEEYHPGPAFLAVLAKRDVDFVVGSDAHTPEGLCERHEVLPAALADRDVEPVTLEDVGT